jgi:hypothetical protein
MEDRRILLIPPCNTYGDCLSVIGLTYFLSEKYDAVYFYLDPLNPDVIKYYSDYFKNDIKFNTRIFITNNPYELFESYRYTEFHICNLNTANWDGPMWDFLNHPNVNKDHYFNCSNPIADHLKIKDDLKSIPNCVLPNKSLEINHLFYYKMIGLSNKVRMDYFNYARNIEYEKKITEKILGERGITWGRYNVINDPIGKENEIKEFIKNDYPIININNISDSPGNLLNLIESAAEIHLIEGSNTNFIYHCQYKRIFNYNKKINFHVWARNRKWEQYNLDYAWKMMDTPRMENWDFIFDSSHK